MKNLLLPALLALVVSTTSCKHNENVEPKPAGDTTASNTPVVDPRTKYTGDFDITLQYETSYYYDVRRDTSLATLSVTLKDSVVTSAPDPYILEKGFTLTIRKKDGSQIVENVVMYGSGNLKQDVDGVNSSDIGGFIGTDSINYSYYTAYWHTSRKATIFGHRK